MQLTACDREAVFARQHLDLTRRALCALSGSPEPGSARSVHVHRISHLLRAVLPREGVGESLERLEVLTETIRLPRGYWLPSPVRCVDAHGVQIVLAPHPTSDLRKMLDVPIFVAGSGRVTEVAPQGVPQQDYWSWTAAPRDTSLWANAMLAELRGRLRETTLDAAGIDIHAAPGSTGPQSSKEVGQWVRLSALKTFSGETLCRARVGLKAYRYFFAAISHGVITHESEVQPRHRARLRFGLDLSNGNRHRIRVRRKGDALQFELYRPLPSEELRLIHALCTSYSDDGGVVRQVIEVDRKYFMPILVGMRHIGIDLELDE
jgi:hypothetical protein